MRMLVCLLVGILQVAPLAAQDFPNKPIHIIAPFGPGTATDTVARIIAIPPTWSLSGLNASSRWLS